ncbi:hypothetical protein Clacol_002391 [Clathrus columnatus]|uniref:DUF6534 domain-containing protein n=1 Tax=Clathrus columnatus TaxID=1419009 RepID=A0AAV5A4Q6_9AGAM|nr:hypothetical protein Clacol_002391 [Clathrus columnatus]
MNATSAQAQAQAQAEAALVQTILQSLGQTMGATLVIILTLLDTFALVATMHSIWFNLIQNFANPVAVFTVDWGVASSVITTAVIGFVVQSFYAYRAYILSGRKIWIPAIISLTTSSLVCSIVSDLAITISVTRYLLKGKQKEFRRTEVLIRKLVLYTINTGVITTVCTVIALILSEVRTNNLYDLIFYYMLSKCYVNSMLAFLNARESLRKGSNVVSFRLGDTSTSGPKFRGMSDSEALSESGGKASSDIRGASATVVHDSKVNLPTGYTGITVNTVTTHDHDPPYME